MRVRQMVPMVLVAVALAVPISAGQHGATHTHSSQPPAPPASAPLLTSFDLTYSGAFRLPAGPNDARSFDYGGRGLTFNPARNTLFLVGHDWYQWVAELNIPTPSKATSIAALPTATFRQPFTGVFSHGELNAVGWGAAVGGLIVSGQELIVSAYVTYDANGTQSRSHFRRSADLAKPGLHGPSSIANARAGFVAGYMGTIPAAWQKALGGPALTGLCCVSIISRTSLGPAASVFNPAQVGVVPVVPATQVLAYPITQPTLGLCEGASTMFNCTTIMGGVAFPEGTRSVLFFGRQGLGTYCYGTGGAAGGDCYDPTDSSKGTHGYPYAYQVWAYDVLDLIAVKEGQKKPWEVQPYQTWNFELPFQNGARVIRSVAYDPATSRIFVTAAFSDGARPLIHVFTVRR